MWRHWIQCIGWTTLYLKSTCIYQDQEIQTGVRSFWLLYISFGFHKSTVTCWPAQHLSVLCFMEVIISMLSLIRFNCEGSAMGKINRSVTTLWDVAVSSPSDSFSSRQIKLEEKEYTSRLQHTSSPEVNTLLIL
jgi:hypothetical protein